MAELDTSSGGGHKKGPGVKKGKKASTRVDLTPMVDLGFLLITFFMFATTLATPKAAKFRMPKDDVKDKDLMEANKDAAMIALIGPSKDSVYYYEGDDPSSPDPKKGLNLISMKDFRKRVLEKRETLKTMNIPDSLMLLSIKPMNGSYYGTFMQLFDEVSINDIKSYVKVKPSPDELKIVGLYNQANNLPPIPTEGFKPAPKGTAVNTEKKN